MTLQDFLDAASAFINQEHPNFRMGVDRFNVFLNLANLDYFKQWTGLPEEWQPGKPVTKRGWQVAEQNTDALRSFLVTEAKTVDVNGQVAYPSNFVHLTRLSFNNPDTARIRPIEIVSDSVVDDRLGDAITAPENEYPIVVYRDSYLQFYPITLQSINWSYLRLPSTPVYASQVLNSTNVYDPSTSVQFEWPEYLHNDLLRMILGYITIAAKDGGVSQYIETKKVQGV